MNPDLFRRAREIFDEAVELPEPEREAFLRDTCVDAALREEVEALLDAASARTLAEDVREAMSDLTEPGSAADVVSGRRIGPYELVREIGRGGMGTVCLAVRADEAFHKVVALKLVSGGLEAAYFLKRFRAERQILASLTHPNIAMLLDGGTTDEGLPYFVMEYVDGRPIDEWCDGEGGLAGAEGATLPVRLRRRPARPPQPDRPPGPEALEHLRHAGRACRSSSISASRVLLTPEAGAERTATEWRALTPAYASPEQVRGDPVTTASDVYSLGIVLYALLTGRKPYRAATGEPAALLNAVLTEEPVPPGAAAPQAEIPRDLDAIVLKALRKEPRDRYADAGELAQDLERFLDGKRVQADVRYVRVRVAPLRVAKRPALAAGAAAAAAVAAVAFALWRSGSAGDVRRRRPAPRRLLPPPRRRRSRSCRSSRSFRPTRTRCWSSAWRTPSSRS